MARPQKHGLDYFPFDCDFFDDEKIVAINGQFGIKGEIAAVKLLCAIYRNGYFIKWCDAVKIKLLGSVSVAASRSGVWVASPSLASQREHACQCPDASLLQETAKS